MFSKRRGNPSNTIKEVMEEKKLDCMKTKKRELLQYSTDNSRFYQRPVRESNPQLALRSPPRWAKISFMTVTQSQVKSRFKTTFVSIPVNQKLSL